MRAWLNLRYTPASRVEAFKAGIERHGYRVEMGACNAPGSKDILITWNRIGFGDTSARKFERAGRPVIVTENASWGNDSFGGHWLTLARNFHNMSGMFPIGGNERWDNLRVTLKPWRTSGETVILPQRGFGPREVAMPKGWQFHQSGRIRKHPGKYDCVPLFDDLAKAGKVVTWGSAAAVQALSWGIPVKSCMPRWIGEQDNTDAGRLAMFRRMAWAQWRLHEIQNGDAFAWLLASPA